MLKKTVDAMLRYANSGETTGSSILTTKDVTKITEKIFKVLLYMMIDSQHGQICTEIFL